jgi:hypothetical protein
MNEMQKISFNQIRKTYNGKSGCACGCNGSYTLPSHVSIEEANAEAGWNAYSADDISDHSAKIALTKINKAIDEYGPLAKLDAHSGKYQEYSALGIWFCYNENFVGIDINGRATTVYF